MLLLFLPWLLLALACQATQPRVVEVTVAVTKEITREVQVEVTTTPVPTEAPLPTATEPATPTEEPTATLSPILATVQAMGAQVTVQPGGTSEPAIAPDDYPAIVDRACAIVQENYVRDNFNGVDWPATCTEYHQLAENVQSQEAFWDLMDAFIAELNDNHSRFVRPDDFAAEFDLPSTGEGVAWPGLIIWPAREDERLLLWRVCEFGPAADAGLQRGDVVLAFNGTPAESVPEEEIGRILYSGQEEEVTLTVQRGPENEPEDITLEYGPAFNCDGWSYDLLSQEPRIGYIRVFDFSGAASTLIEGAIGEMEEEAPLDGLIVDVRHNPGGNSDESIAIFTSGDFGLVGPLRADATQGVYRIRGPVRWNETTPVVVLTDGASHSAAEYFATAMQQSGRATLVGMPTAGNTEGITGFSLPDGSLIRLAVMTLQLPDGRTLEETGVVPDLEVPLGEWGLRQEPDVQLQAGLDTLLEMIGQ